MKKLMCGVLIVVMMLSLVACGTKLSGTYETDGILGSYVSYKFSGGKLTVTTYVLGNVVATVEGTYKIDGDQITITYNTDNDDNEGISGTQSFEKTDDGIKIGVLTLKKA